MIASHRVSQRVRSIPQALSIYINEIVYEQKRRGHDITTLSLGEAFFDIPMFDFSKLDFVRGYHYSDSRGLPELRREIADFYTRHYDVSLDSGREILITAGSKAAIYLAILATISPGERVLIHEPAWLSYQEHIKLADGVPSFIPYGIAPMEFGEWLKAGTRMLIINNPNNPAGRVYTPEELQSIVRLCRNAGVWLLVDEAYSDFLPPGQFHSALEFDPERDTVVVANSLSKNMGMSGWRIGYLMAKDDLIDQVLKLNQHIITCAPTILQAYLARYFHQIISITLPQAQAVVAKRARVARLIERHGLECLGGGATFYFFLGIGDHPSSCLDLVLYLLMSHNVAVVPGAAYGVSTERFVRLSIGTESEERIEDALVIIRNVLDRRENVSHFVSERLSKAGFRRFCNADG